MTNLSNAENSDKYLNRFLNECALATLVPQLHPRLAVELCSRAGLALGTSGAPRQSTAVLSRLSPRAMGLMPNTCTCSLPSALHREESPP